MKNTTAGKMSNESTASESTPFRRPESQNSFDVSSSLLLLAKSRDVEKHYRNLNHNSNDISNSNCSCDNVNGNGNGNGNSNSNTSSATVSTTAALAIANLNNNNVEVRLCAGSGEESIEQISKTNKMDHNKRVLYRVALDVFILLCVGFPILLFYLWGSAYQRGFFCDDESLKHPFKESTVKNWMLYFVGLVLPIGVTLAVEIVRAERSKTSSDGAFPTRRYIFMDYEVPAWMVECYKKIGIFGFGAAVSQLTTDIAKYSIGRLRPHFFAVCQPILSDGTTCDDPNNVGKYIEDFTCKGDDSTKRMLKEVHLSFPSGHSSFTFYTMVYTALYLQSRMDWKGSKLLRHSLQFLFIMIAWYTALSRVSDYKHHWSDVLAGSCIGALSAVIVSNFLPKDWFNWNTVWPVKHNKMR
ncbi:putative phosphatidate phosphatase isoform X2 [Rhagoletis pomonella]|uniref:putative phosphatidate phosphatase isoform X2 n=1 Tax=Rhagoletis pomonella TaxID=28610 RepID=UPI0017846BD6|nr:putative phosphatidate phosphatase isoform X2 [Rhagoletis pomonella]